MSGEDDGVHLVLDFVFAALQFAAGDHDSALEVLLPAELPAQDRLPRMLAVGALLSGNLLTRRGSSPGGLVGELAAAGAQLDGDAIRELVAAHAEHRGLLVELLAVFAAWDAAGSKAVQSTEGETR